MDIKRVIFQNFFKKMKSYRLGIFLALCIVLGGTSQSEVMFKLPVYMISVIMMTWVLLENKIRVSILFNSLFFKILLCGFCLSIIYLIPLPPEIWTKLPGRDVSVNGFRVVSQNTPWMPISLAPEKSLFAILHLLPPLAVCFTTILSADKEEVRNGYIFIILFAVLSVFLGFFQLVSGGTEHYLYEISHFNMATGFFSNANHQAMFLVILLPFAVYKIFNSSGGFVSQNLMRLLAICVTILLLVGVVLTESIAGYVLAFVSLIMSVASFKGRINKVYIIAGCLLAGGILFVDFVFLAKMTPELISELNYDREGMRLKMLKTTAQAIKESFPFGTGPGSFEDVYKVYQDRSAITNRYVNNAHNDFIQIALEFGVFGMAFILVIFFSVMKRLVAFIRGGEVTTFGWLILVSSIMVLLHSLVDYPLRTISISTLLVFLNVSYEKFPKFKV